MLWESMIYIRLNVYSSDSGSLKSREQIQVSIIRTHGDSEPQRGSLSCVTGRRWVTPGVGSRPSVKVWDPPRVKELSPFCLKWQGPKSPIYPNRYTFPCKQKPISCHSKGCRSSLLRQEVHSKKKTKEKRKILRPSFRFELVPH